VVVFVVVAVAVVVVLVVMFAVVCCDVLGLPRVTAIVAVLLCNVTNDDDDNDGA